MLQTRMSHRHQVINTSAMKFLGNLILFCSAKVRLGLVKTDLLPQLITTLNPQSLDFAEAVNIHTGLIKIINYSLWLTTQNGLAKLEIKDDDDHSAVHETIFQQVLTPSEKYISLLCVNRSSIVDGEPSLQFLKLLARLLDICWDSLSPVSLLVTTLSFSFAASLTFSHCSFLKDSVFIDLCSIATCTITLPSGSPLTTLGETRAGSCSFEAQAIIASTVLLLHVL
ncbi:hypothetical protein BLNAU_23574 [Blattamonas nauphoetae]|uniref:Uncharacterized protein n=1 Tax=Blattamonas nauphoetae TaxID=2049346 RepID=A0ABQ9WSS8_9EUKA|nr:hypothetical protein BLNAU_23574 [Blattamonas nauphoetae]